MSLAILGQSGGPTRLSANDDVFGMMTQDPTGALKHSPGGFTNSDGNSAFGSTFTIMAYFEHVTTAAEQITTVSFCSANAPYKFRVLGIKVRCIDSKSSQFKSGYGRVQVVIEDGSSSGVFTPLLPWSEVGDMDSGDSREISVVNQASAVIDEGEGLRCRMSSASNAAGTLPTVKFMVEVQCIRVV